MNYAKLDRMIDFRYATDKYKAAGDLGFGYISEAIIKLYPDYSSFYIAKCFEVYNGTITRWLRIWNIKRKPAGDQGRWIKKYGSDNCINCGIKTYIGHRNNGRCIKCFKYFHRNGIEHPNRILKNGGI